MTKITKIHKGQRINVRGIVVLVLRREKWNSREYRLSYGDCGNGFPTGGPGTSTRHAALPIDFEMWPTSAEFEVVEIPIVNVVGKLLQKHWRWKGRPVRVRVTKEVIGYAISWQRYFGLEHGWRTWRCYQGGPNLRETIHEYRDYALGWRGF